MTTHTLNDAKSKVTQNQTEQKSKANQFSSLADVDLGMLAIALEQARPDEEIETDSI